jgi:4-diphosphocytidyl-2-C-methyl-D-erythritol kinase
MGAGLGGGSADAAGVLFGLNRLWCLNLTREKLEELGLSLGADVPFCLHGGLVRTRGIGELLEDHPCGINYWLLIFQPCRALSTREIFEAYHASESVSRPDTENVLSALAAGDSERLSRSVGNVLESVSAARCPEIPEAVSALKNAGAFAARMTGSGSAVFGVFRSRALAEKARDLLSRQYRSIHLCHTQSDSIRVMEEDLP